MYEWPRNKAPFYDHVLDALSSINQKSNSKFDGDEYAKCMPSIPSDKQATSARVRNKSKKHMPLASLRADHAAAASRRRYEGASVHISDIQRYSRVA